MLFAKNNNNLKSHSAGPTTRIGGSKAVQSPVRKTGQPSASGTKANIAPAPIPPKAVEPARPPKAPNRPKPPVASKTMAASKVLTMAQFPGTLRSVSTFKALDVANPSTIPKAPRLTKPLNGLKTLAASKLLDVSLSTGGPTAPPGLSPPCSSAPRAAAVEAVRRRISEQKEKTAVVAARKAKPEFLPSTKPKAAITRGATPPSASTSRPRAKIVTAKADASENVPPPSTPTRRPIPAVRKGGVRKPLASVYRNSISSSSTSSARSPGSCGSHQRNTLYAAACLPERSSLVRKNAFVKPKSSVPARTVPKSGSAPLLGRARTPAAAVTRSQSGPAIVSKAVRLAIPFAADRDFLPNVAPVYDSDDSSADEAMVEVNLNAWTSDANTFSSAGTLVQSDDEHTDVDHHLVTSPLTSLASARLQLSIQDFNIQSVIGQGAFGKVALASLKGSQRTYAVKIVAKSKLHSPLLRSQMLREQEITRMVSGLPFLAGIEASFHDSINFYLLMEYYPTSLHDYWRDAGSIPSELTRLWTAEMAFGLNALHVRGIVHRDFKLDNVLLGADGHVRVADFGLAKRFAVPVLAVPAVFANGKPIPGRVMYVDPTTAGVMGTWKYMAPELLLDQPYSYPVDWWAFGVAVYAMCFGHLPWDHSKLAELKKLILYTKIPIAPFWACDPELRMVIYMALEKNPMFRVTFNTIQAMPFFCNINWACIGSMPIKLPAPSANRSGRPRPRPAISAFTPDATAIPAHPDAHPQFTWAGAAFTADKAAADAVLADEQLVRDAIVSLDGEAPVFDAPAAWKAAFSCGARVAPADGSALSGASEVTAVSGSPAPSREAKAAPMSRLLKGDKLKKWWKRVVCKKQCGRA